MANVVLTGFRPWGSKSGGKGVFPQAMRFEVASGYATAVSAGDVVELHTDGTVQVAAAGETEILGIVSHVSYVTGGKRIFDTQIPASTTYSPTARRSANASYAYVWTGPDVIYSVSIAAAGDANHDAAAELFDMIGANMDHVATAASTTYKVSRHELDGTLVEGSAAGFRIIGIDEEINNDPLASRGRVLCVINEGIDPVFTSTSTS